MLRLILLLVLPFSLFPCMLSPQPTTFMGAMAQRNEINKIQDAAKDQTKGISKIERAITEFKLWLTNQNMSTYAKDLYSKYNANKDEEENYAKYMQSTASPNAFIAPAGYRLTEYRLTFTPLSEAMSDYNKVTEILETRVSIAESVTGKIQNLSPLEDDSAKYEHVSQLSALIDDYQAKNQQNLLVGQASPDIIKRVHDAEATVTQLTTQVTTLRDQIKTYLTTMGIIPKALVDSEDDLKDMAESVEEILTNDIDGKKIGTSRVGINIANFIAERYAGTADDTTHNPFFLQIKDESDLVAGIPLKDINATLMDYRMSLLDAAQKIRDLATPQTGKLDPLKPNVYFDKTMIPPDITQMEKSTNVHRYMYPGYLGYWLQQIVDRLHECTLFGAEILHARVTLLQWDAKLRSTCLSPCSALSQDLDALPFFNDPTLPSVNIKALQNAIASALNVNQIKSATGADYQKLSATMGKQLDNLQQAAPLAFTFVNPKSPLGIGVIELMRVRRTMFLVSLLNTLANNKPFDPSSYTDLFGTIPNPDAFFPQLANTGGNA